MTFYSAALPDVKSKPTTKEKLKPAKGWKVIVWNDPINTMSFVTYVFRKVLSFSKELATTHMMEVHVKGKSCVAKSSREKAELYWEQLQSYGLKTTLEEGD